MSAADGREALPGWEDIPEGYYAIPDPEDPERITYWRRHTSQRTSALTAWPAKAWYGPARLTKAAVRDAADPQQLWRDWAATREAYLEKVVAGILADTVTAARRFAAFATRCCNCGRVLRDNTSKTYGIGPECRSGLPAEVLAAHHAAAVGTAHAEFLAGRDTEDPEP